MQDVAGCRMWRDAAESRQDTAEMLKWILSSGVCIPFQGSRAGWTLSHPEDPEPVEAGIPRIPRSRTSGVGLVQPSLHEQAFEKEGERREMRMRSHRGGEELADVTSLASAAARDIYLDAAGMGRDGMG